MPDSARMAMPSPSSQPLQPAPSFASPPPLEPVTDAYQPAVAAPVAAAPAAAAAPAPAPAHEPETLADVPAAQAAFEAATAGSPYALPEPAADPMPDQHLRSLAMPGVDHEPGPALSLAPELPAPVTEPEGGIDVSGTVRSPSVAIIAGMFALAWQLITFYGAAILPGRLTSGGALDRFDQIVDRLPLAGGSGGTVVGMLAALCAAGLLAVSWRSGVRETLLQGAAAFLVFLALTAPLLLPKLFGA
ncbi:MAG: hypothetical protein JWM90_1711 [Thermoleophilia bacterium]|nr:hypothetical protein [Thermoleophilia bacterium]